MIPRSRGEGTSRVKKRKKKKNRISLYTKIPTLGSEDWNQSGPLEKHTQSPPELSTQRTGGSSIYPLCSVPHWLRVDLVDANIPTLWGCTCMETEQAPVASEKALGKRGERHTAHTWSMALSAQGEYELAWNCPLQLRLQTEVGWGEMTLGARGICYIRHPEKFWPSYCC